MGNISSLSKIYPQECYLGPEKIFPVGIYTNTYFWGPRNSFWGPESRAQRADQRRRGGRPKLAMTSARTSSVAVAVTQVTGSGPLLPPNNWRTRPSPRYAGLNSRPHCEIQCASSITSRATENCDAAKVSQCFTSHSAVAYNSRGCDGLWREYAVPVQTRKEN